MTRIGQWRGSTAQTFLKEAQGRPNLRVETEAVATKLLFEGKRCVGVAFRQRGRDIELRAGKEVILSGGAINSPHLLQISGIGPAEHLQSIGVPAQVPPEQVEPGPQWTLAQGSSQWPPWQRWPTGTP